MRRFALRLLSGLLLTIPLSALPASAATVYGPELQGFDYPYTVKHFAFASQGKSLQMAYMDVAAQGQCQWPDRGADARQEFLWRDLGNSIKALSEAGYRVIVPDQIGFCTSSNPHHYQYTFQQLATNTQPC